MNRHPSSLIDAIFYSTSWAWLLGSESLVPLVRRVRPVLIHYGFNWCWSTCSRPFQPVALFHSPRFDDSFFVLNILLLHLNENFSRSMPLVFSISFCCLACFVLGKTIFPKRIVSDAIPLISLRADSAGWISSNHARQCRDLGRGSRRGERFAFQIPVRWNSRRIFRVIYRNVVIPPPNCPETVRSIFSKLVSKVIDAAIVLWYATHTKNKLVSSTCYKEARRTLPTTMDYAAVSFPKV